MAQSKERLPSDLAASLLTAARGTDPQKSFSDVFGSGAVPVAEPKPTETIEKPRPQKASRPIVRKASPSVEEGWSRKTYRLRPDQYRTLAALEALLTSESGRRIAVSELARDAFDLLFSKHKNLLARLSAQEQPESETAA